MPKQRPWKKWRALDRNRQWKITLRIMTAEADSPTTDAKQLLEDYGLAGCHSKEAIICLFMQELTPQDIFDSCGIQMKKKTRAHMQRSLR